MNHYHTNRRTGYARRIGGVPLALPGSGVRAARAGALGQEVPGRGGRGTALITRSTRATVSNCLPDSALTPRTRHARSAATAATARRIHEHRLRTDADTSGVWAALARTRRTPLTRIRRSGSAERSRAPAPPRAPGRPVGITPGASASPSALYIGQHVTHGTLNQATLLRFRLNRRGNQRPQSPRSLWETHSTLAPNRRSREGSTSISRARFAHYDRCAPTEHVPR